MQLLLSLPFDSFVSAVTTAGERVDGPLSDHVTLDRLVLNHYVTKSVQDFAEKMRRGSGMGNKKTVEFWTYVQEK